ncbi:hypothetical protein NMY3_00550 [Candidatus Nitrosocosmicus oleophilus]|uniref:PIN domain-containing protein n=1 Tax=Candidatus Nitrosocosmicus oleophilus TaxID=1353260 RepID=A0A654M646_9ARCH|nr:hypothetical protein [Candidatus Nitrosocosmicus oleophilus]ALI34762.1 hypothetical protein NMY3_00550 [Candidatus Nitrosocosmicus oleophilus]
MKYILPDANTLISLRQIKEIDLLNKICIKSKLDIILSEKVMNEVDKGRLEREIGMSKYDHVKSYPTDPSRYESMRRKIIENFLLSLGKGEMDIFAIIDACEDRTFSNYLIITDDQEASQVSTYLKMKYCNICDFLKLALSNEVIIKEKYLDIISKLKSNGRISSVRHDYCKELLKKE